MQDLSGKIVIYDVHLSLLVNNFLENHFSGRFDVMSVKQMTSCAFPMRADTGMCPSPVAVAAKTHQMVQERHGASAGVFLHG